MFSVYYHRFLAPTPVPSPNELARRRRWYRRADCRRAEDRQLMDACARFCEPGFGQVTRFLAARAKPMANPAQLTGTSARSCSRRQPRAKPPPWHEQAPVPSLVPRRWRWARPSRASPHAGNYSSATAEPPFCAPRGDRDFGEDARVAEPRPSNGVARPPCLVSGCQAATGRASCIALIRSLFASAVSSLGVEKATTISSAFSEAVRSSKILGAGSAKTRGWASTMPRTLSSVGCNSVSSPIRTRASAAGGGAG